MNTSLRRATPDSEAIASSEDERPWPAAPSFGNLPHKENSVPGLGGGIWSTQKRGSFKMEKAAQRNAAREAWLGAPGQPRSGLRNDSTPSPSASEKSAALPFSIPLHPAPKAGRSLSHSQGQREYPPVTGALSSQPDHAPALPLGLLAEEVDTESESELGAGLTQTTSHPPIGTLHRTATFPATYNSYYGASNGKEHGEEAAGGEQGASRGDRRFEGAFANLTLASEQPQRRSQWQTHLGWDDVPNVNESRRHSLADIPTRRGSLAGATEHRNTGGGQFWQDGRAYDWEGDHHAYSNTQYTNTASPLELASRVTRAPIDDNMDTPAFAAFRAGAAQRQAQRQAERYAQIEAQGAVMPQSYRTPPVTLSITDRSTNTIQEIDTPPTGPPTGQRPRKQLFIVSFKCSRVDVFYLFDNTGLDIGEGDIVIVEADRGQDLGTVQHAHVSQEEARSYKRRYGEEQYKWLMMFSKNNNQNSVNPNAQVYSGGSRGPSQISHQGPAPSMLQGGMARENHNNLKPKAIKRLASQHEIRMLGEKEGNEAKAKRTCQNKVTTLHLEMEILDAEWQWDFQKLIFYYYADHYINFKDLVTELYRIYKTRIWLSAVNPASFSQHALGTPPSGYGPGALTGADRDAYYAAGADPDPYGAIPPYQIGFQTYDPNYAAIPGVVNSFPNTAASMAYTPNIYTQSYTSIGEAGSYGSGHATPSGTMPAINNVATPGGYGLYSGYGYGGMSYDSNLSGATLVNTPPMWLSPTDTITSFSAQRPDGSPSGFDPYSYGGAHRPRKAAWDAGASSNPIPIPERPSPGRNPLMDEDVDPGSLSLKPSQRPPGTYSRRHVPMWQRGYGRLPAHLRPNTLSEAHLNPVVEDTAKPGLMEHFLDSLQNEDDARADEMSRER